MNEKNRKCVGIVFGGQSNEHAVSIESAKEIFNALNSDINNKKFSTKVFYINKHGKWFSSNESLNVLKDKKFFENLNLQLPKRNLNIIDLIDFQEIDIWFPVIHGTNGEDGTIQGLLKFTQKPIVSSGILGSALGMDKIIMKLIFSYLNIPQVNYHIIQNKDLTDENNLKLIHDEITNKLKLPYFIKPANSGSSIGISKVMDKSDINAALQKAWKFDNRIVVEEGLEVRELEVGIMGKSNLVASEIGEVNYSSDWYDYESKYKGNNKLIIPANIDKNLRERIQTLSIESCMFLNINIFARVDFFLEKATNNIYLNEINTVPGFTTNSMFPLLWRSSGLEINELVAKIIEYCL